jgi:hypothetical protein
MILTTHALVGAAIGKNIANPWLIIPIALTSHFILDSIRHGEYFDDRIATIKNTWWKVALDLSLGFFVITTYLFSKNMAEIAAFNIFLGTFFSMLPDSLTLLHWAFSKNQILAKIKTFHAFCHRYSRFSKYSPERQWTLPNARNDILISLLAILFLFIK